MVNDHRSRAVLTFSKVNVRLHIVDKRFCCPLLSRVPTISTAITVAPNRTTVKVDVNLQSALICLVRVARRDENNLSHVRVGLVTTTAVVLDKLIEENVTNSKRKQLTLSYSSFNF